MSEIIIRNLNLGDLINIAAALETITQDAPEESDYESDSAFEEAQEEHKKMVETLEKINTLVFYHDDVD